jgi:hypothetical protein
MSLRESILYDEEKSWESAILIRSLKEESQVREEVPYLLLMVVNLRSSE